MQFIKELNILEIEKKDEIYDIVIECWCVRNRFYAMPEETTTRVKYTEFPDRVKFNVLIKELINRSEAEKDKTFILRNFIARLLFYKMQNKLNSKNTKAQTVFDTLSDQFLEHCEVDIPIGFEFSELPKLSVYTTKDAPNIIRECILYDLVRAKNKILKPSKVDKEAFLAGFLNSAARKGSMVKNQGSKIMGVVRDHSPFRRSRSGSILKAESSPAASKLQISAPILPADKASSKERDDGSDSDITVLTENSRLIPAASSNPKAPSYRSTGSDSSISVALSPPSSAPSAAFYKPSAPSSFKPPAQSVNKNARTQDDDNLPPIELFFITLYSPETGKIMINCPDVKNAQIIQDRLGKRIATRINDMISISCKDWAENKERFNTDLPEQFQKLSQQIEKAYCGGMNIPYVPPKNSPLSSAAISLNNEPDSEQDDDSAKSRFCCC